MPRIPQDPVARYEQGWVDFQERLADRLQLLVYGEYMILHTPDESRFVQFLRLDEASADVLLAEVAGPESDGGTASYSAEEQLRILDLGWDPPTHADADDYANFRAVWVSNVKDHRRRHTIEPWISDNDVADVAELVVETLRGPLGVTSAADLLVETDRFEWADPPRRLPNWVQREG